MTKIWNHCRYYAGKLSLLLMMILGTVNDLHTGANKRLLLNQNNGFGPISRSRDKRKRHIIIAECFVIAVSFLILTIYRMFTSLVVFNPSDFYMLGSILFSIILSEFIRRCCLLAEEIRHVKERYMGSSVKAIEACILRERLVEMGVVFSVCLAITIKGWINDEISSFPVLVYIIASTCGTVFIDLLKVKRISEVEISEMNEAGTNNVAAGLAWSYYFGYLKIILPEFLNTFQKARGEGYKIDNDDICDKISEKNRRLYIIIPKDGYCYNDFNDLDSRITSVQQMPEQLKSRGGVHGRSYKNNLYKIEKDGQNPRYIVMEYPTPILSMYDMSQYQRAKFSDADRKGQVVEFYKTLEIILSQDPECFGRAKIILIGEGATANFDGKMLADIIWNNLD